MTPFNVMSLLLPWASTGSMFDQVNPGSVAFFELGVCGNGKPAYYGLINPSELIHPDKFYIEMMGGASCFNYESCKNHGLENWIDIDKFMKRHLSIDANMVMALKSGMSIPLAMMVQMKAGYYATDESHPFWGRRGLYLVMCTGDLFLGKHNATYEPSPLPGPPPSGGCNESVDADNYRGCQNYTRSGYGCQKWTAQVPHRHSYNNETIATYDLGDHNYCRNTPDTVGLWCYTSNPNLRWDWCDPADVAPTAMNILHHGGRNTAQILEMIQQEMPNLTHLSVIGASGGGVASTAWASNLADMWPSADVVVVADSALHIFPGTQVYDYVWDLARYGQGPIAKSTPSYTDVNVPDFDWRVTDALAKHVASHDGRLKLAYISCMDDTVLYQDRRTLATFAHLDNQMEALLDHEDQHSKTWSFLNTLHECAPAGSVFSYIQNCSNHHQTRSGYQESIPNAVDAQTYVNNLLGGSSPDNSARAKFWYEEHTQSGITCPSEVRRRRAQASQDQSEQDASDGEGSQDQSEQDASDGEGSQDPSQQNPSLGQGSQNQSQSEEASRSRSLEVGLALIVSVASLNF